MGNTVVDMDHMDADKDYRWRHDGEKWPLRRCYI